MATASDYFWSEISGSDAARTLPSQLAAILDQIAATIGDDSGWLTSGIVGAGSGGAISTTVLRRTNLNVVSISFTVTIATAISVPPSGNIANTQIALITDPAFQPTRAQVLSAYASGPVASGYVTAGGIITLTGIAPGNTLGVGDVVSLGGIYLLG